MTVAELIEALEKLDRAAVVMVCCDTELGDYTEADGVVTGRTDRERMRFSTSDHLPGFDQAAVEIS